jgi:two-component system CheB/CheR fusion protein
LLEGEGNRVLAALGSEDALELVMQEGCTPDLVIADFKLSSNLDGLQLIARVRTLVQRGIPAIVLTGDISTDTLRAVARAGHLHLHKPATAKSLIAHIYRLLARAPSPGASDRRGPTTEAAPGAPKVFVVDDHRLVRAAMRDSLQGQGWHVDIFASCEAFLGAYRRGERGCLVVDDRMPGMTGIQLLERLRAGGDRLPVIIVTGFGEIRTAVEAMKAGAADFLEKPVGREALLATIHRVLALPDEDAERVQSQRLAAERLGHLTTREREVMERVLAGHASKNIAADLRISQRTVENHRASLMKKSATRSLAEFIRLALAAREASQEGRVES